RFRRQGGEICSHSTTMSEGSVESAIGIVARHGKVFVRGIIVLEGLSDDYQFAISLDRHRVGAVGAATKIGCHLAANSECRVQIASGSMCCLRTNNEPSQHSRRGNDSAARNQTIVEF